MAPMSRTRAEARRSNLEIADAPCECCCRPPGGAIRVDIGEDGHQPPKRRSKHDAIRSPVDDDEPRAEVGAVANLGRLIRFTPVDLPNVPAQRAFQLAAGAEARRVRSA